MDTTQLSLIKKLSAFLKGFAVASVISLLAACGGSDSSSDREDTTDSSNKTPDSTPPVITLNGEASIQLEAGSKYIEAGATAEDDVDGEVSVSITGSVDINKVGKYTLTYKATDSSSNKATKTRTVTVVDTTPPVITLIGESGIQVEAGTGYLDAGATAEDSVDGEIAVIVVGYVNTNDLGYYTLTYTGVDSSNNSHTISRTISVVDTTPPTVTLNGEIRIQVEAGTIYQEEGAIAQDYVDDLLRISITGEVDTSAVGEYTITYTSTDRSGNTQTELRSVAVVDTTPPSITLTGNTVVELETGTGYQEAGATAVDFVDGDVGVSITGTVDSNTLGEYILTYTTSDSSGNTSSVHRNITVVDTVAPIIALQGASILELDIGESYIEPGYTATDNYDETVQVNVVGSVNPLIAGDYLLTYTALDSSGNTSSITRTITVNRIRAFITTWKTDNDGKTNSNQIEINTSEGSNFTVDWGDGYIDSGITNDIVHTYDVPGTYTVKITGDFTRFYFSGGYSDNQKLLSVDQWGDVRWSSMQNAFLGTINMRLLASDTPDLSQVIDMKGMFRGASLINSDLNRWDVSAVRDMTAMFYQAESFNGDLSDWNISNVTNTSYMFYAARAFNSDISNWNVSNITNMHAMFSGAHSFNSDLSRWDVSNVKNMHAMFMGATNFNGNLNSWNVSDVANMQCMFAGARLFNSELNQWNTSNVTNMKCMFYRTDSFNRDLNNWDVSNVNDMSTMFFDAIMFDGDISNWNISSVKNMHRLFGGARSFNGDISNWDVSNVTNMSGMFSDAEAFTGDISGWDVSSVTNMSDIFRVNGSFNSDISNWDVSSVTNMSGMFYGAHNFNGDLSNWDVSNVTEMNNMFTFAESFNNDISNWDVSNVRSMNHMFSVAKLFDVDISSWDVSNVISMENMFSHTDRFNKNLSGWDVSSVSNMNNMFNDSVLSTENYDAILNGWAALPSLQAGVSFATSSEYSSAAESARNVLVNTYGWDITDGGLATEE